MSHHIHSRLSAQVKVYHSHDSSVVLWPLYLTEQIIFCQANNNYDYMIGIDSVCLVSSPRKRDKFSLQ